MAFRVDALFYYLVGFSVFFTVLIFGSIIWFSIKYRRRYPDEFGADVQPDLRLELAWTLIPFAMTLVMFFWGAKLFFITYDPPDNALEVGVVAKQWMWKAQHPEGQREINALHVPVGQPLKLILTSEDVIHSFGVPAFRFKRDVIPGRYTVAWFEATTPGEYHLFCDQYCGTLHAGMVGTIIVMPQAEYHRWLTSTETGVSMATSGERLFTQLGCDNCHGASDTPRGPSLVGLFGKTVKLQAGGSTKADEGYIRESIINPRAQVVAGYRPIMPSFAGLISEDAILDIIQYIKSLNGQKQEQANR